MKMRSLVVSLAVIGLASGASLTRAEELVKPIQPPKQINLGMVELGKKLAQDIIPELDAATEPPTSTAGSEAGICVTADQYREWVSPDESERIEARWGEPPSPDDVRKRDDKRLLADPIFNEPAPESEQAIVKAVLERHGATAVLQGHSHRIEEYRFRGVWYLTSAAVSGAWWAGDWVGSPPGYTLLRCRGRELTWQHHTFAWEPHLEPEDELERQKIAEWEVERAEQARRRDAERAGRPATAPAEVRS